MAHILSLLSAIKVRKWNMSLKINLWKEELRSDLSCPLLSTMWVPRGPILCWRKDLADQGVSTTVLYFRQCKVVSFKRAVINCDIYAAAIDKLWCDFISGFLSDFPGKQSLDNVGKHDIVVLLFTTYVTRLLYSRIRPTPKHTHSSSQVLEINAFVLGFVCLGFFPLFFCLFFQKNSPTSL